MSFYKFDKKEIVLNKVRSHPEVRVFIEKGTSYFNNSSEPGLRPVNHISGSKLLVARNSYDARPLFESTASYNTVTSLPSDVFEKDYYLSSSISLASDYLVGAPATYPNPHDGSEPFDPPNPKLSALRTTLNSYTKNSINYAFSSSISGSEWFKPEQDMMLISIPSLLYGSQIQPGTVDLKFYFTGTLAGQLTDSSKRGELVQVGGADDGKCAGVVLYSEGFMLLTGSWDLNGSTMAVNGFAPKWKFFATQSLAATDTSFDISFNGTSYTPTMMMFAHANRGELNSSNNPTFIQKPASGESEKILITGSYVYMENTKQEVKNIVSSSFSETGSFEKTTYLSSIGIYDDDMNLVGTAKLANPVRKREKDSYTFKLKMDL